jgi:hypothetical protein
LTHLARTAAHGSFDFCLTDRLSPSSTSKPPYYIEMLHDESYLPGAVEPWYPGGPSRVADSGNNGPATVPLTRLTKYGAYHISKISLLETLDTVLA